ncbi:efflux RND transporter periplasmic adaptor subunit [Pseudomonas panipatensis]|uniref:Membrane fusion protein, multidrug efflux system n=1 Tax=Pseudomonas panipatensis TaxID=428992 RepID=A0A1G8EBZ5_9PSED|nr:efflux RND transporter periplasmic adaptor subunit [Pseudomonas panipatensis]SDH67219.1 membrane fusion protein, multidrug efflux system [Pseudomonas panipatensis]SMP37648.1 membrane fusion protein, multidrug efflux system [Pseudomonas panipatensis]
MPFALRSPAFLAVCVLLVASAPSWGLAEEKAPPAPEVTVETAKSGPMPMNLEFSGRAAGYREVQVRAQVGGILQKRSYQEGRPVKQGQVLFQIDPRPYQAALSQAKGALAQAQARYRQTSRDLQRIRELQAKGFASAMELDRFISNYEQAKADVEAAKASVQSKQIDLDFTTVTAPISGMASKQAVSEGSLVVANDPNASLLTELTQLDPIYVNFAYADTEAASLRDGVQSGRLILPERGKLKAELYFGDGSRYPVDGVIDFTDSFVNTGTGTINARAVVDNPSNQLIPGQFLRVVVTGIMRKAVVTVPERALAQGPGGTFVYLVDKEGMARVRQVAASQVVKGRWVIESGISDGDRVIVDGLAKVRPDQPVKALEAPSSPPASPPAQAKQ